MQYFCQTQTVCVSIIYVKFDFTKNVIVQIIMDLAGFLLFLFLLLVILVSNSLAWCLCDWSE